MLTLNDGRSELWQWDTGRTLSVPADCSQVHFSNKVFGRSIDVAVADGVAIIPDTLLQTEKDLNVWAFVGTAENGYTKINKVFKVNKRNKPADYVFTPPEQTTLDELKERLDKIEESQDPDAIKNAVEDYLEQNPVESPVRSVNGKTGKVELTAKDVGAISQGDLQEATNEALHQAKASGEFDGSDGQPGADGITPRVGSNGNWFIGDNDTGIPATGPAGGQGLPGVPGEDGQPGKDGTSPTVSVTDITGGHRVTITDKDGAKTFDVMDGQDAEGGTVTDEQIESAVNKYLEENPIDGGGGELPLLFSATLDEATQTIVINKFPDGKALNLSEWEVLMQVPGGVSYAVPVYAYVIKNDYKGLHTKFAFNDAGASNAFRYRTINAHWVEECAVANAYANRSGPSGDVHRYAYIPNGVVSNSVCLYTYNESAPFPVGTYVEVRGR